MSRLVPLGHHTIHPYTHYDTLRRKHVTRLTWRDLGFDEPVKDDKALTAVKR